MRLFYLLFYLLFLSCNSEQAALYDQPSPVTIQEKKLFKVGEVWANNQFKGARLNNFIQLNDSTYQAIISPENEPINSSAWYAFKIWSESPKSINLEIKYTLHQHRYIPKWSTDGRSWVALDSTNFQIDTSNQKVIIQLTLSQQAQWIAAQELENSTSIYSWMDSLVKQHKLEKNSIGKTVLNEPIYSLERNKGANPSLVLIARQHPPEVPGGTLSFKAFIEECLSENSIAQTFRENFNLIT